MLKNDCGSFYKNTTIEPVGDPGFLAPFLFPEYNTYNKSQAKHRFCIIPHKMDENNLELRSLKDKTILNVQQHWEDMMEDLLDCQFVLSSSLHGVILADAFGIPNKLWQPTTSQESTSKYHDYYLSFGAEGINATTAHSYGQVVVHNLTLVHTINKTTTIQEAVKGVLPLDLRQCYARHILKSFP